jgi:hypothetical protein
MLEVRLLQRLGGFFDQIKLRQKIGRKIFRQADSKELGD